MEKIKSYRDLNIWKLGIEIVEEIYKITNNFPQTEVYALTSQMRRAAISISSNIAEGFSRNHNKEYKQFLYVALGSCAELETQIEIASKLGYVSSNIKEYLLQKTNSLSRMVMSLIKCLVNINKDR